MCKELRHDVKEKKNKLLLFFLKVLGPSRAVQFKQSLKFIACQPVRHELINLGTRCNLK